LLKGRQFMTCSQCTFYSDSGQFGHFSINVNFCDSTIYDRHKKSAVTCKFGHKKTLVLYYGTKVFEMSIFKKYS